MPGAFPWIEGWTITHVAIPGSGQVADAHVTLRTPVGRAVTLRRHMSSKEGLTLQRVSWAGSPVHVEVEMAYGRESTTLQAAAEMTSRDEALPSGSLQVEIHTTFFAVSEEIAQRARNIPVLPGSVLYEAGTTPAKYSALLSKEAVAQFTASLRQAEGVRLLTTPRVTARPSQRASIEVIRELRYPTKFEPQPDPTLGKWLPTDFVTRNVGLTLTAEPMLEEDNLIRLQLIPELVEVEGWADIDTGLALPNSQLDPTQPFGERLKKPALHKELQPGQRVRPVFSTRQLTGSVALRSGESVLFVDLPQTEDTAPFPARDKGGEIMVIITTTLIDPYGNAQ